MEELIVILIDYYRLSPEQITLIRRFGNQMNLYMNEGNMEHILCSAIECFLIKH